jgi:hypothetical protein
MLLGAVACLTGGRAVLQRRILEFHGGWLRWLLARAPISGGAAAITLGHTVLGRTRADLDRCRDHELVHVAQYERWGPFFIPAYFGWSVVLWWQGRRAYLDNPFEVEAYRTATVAPGEKSCRIKGNQGRGSNSDGESR